MIVDEWRNFSKKSLDIVRQMEYNIIGGAFMDRERLQIRVSAELLQQIEKSARKIGVTKSEFCRMAIIQMVAQQGNQGGGYYDPPLLEINNQ